jgi:hypothetical protein
MENPAWPVHDRILGIQSVILTSLMRPQTLERIYDNEARIPANQDALTIPELLDKLHDAIIGDLVTESQRNNGQFTARQPMLSSLRRNLQQEYVERLIDLIEPSSGLSVGEKPIQDLAAVQLREIVMEIDRVRDHPGLDPYSKAHLAETGLRITKALDIPTIGIGAGGDCDGQVLVVDDMLGMFTDFRPKFVKRYAELGQLADAAIAAYAADVRARAFPAPEHGFADAVPKAVK